MAGVSERGNGFRSVVVGLSRTFRELWRAERRFCAIGVRLDLLDLARSWCSALHWLPLRRVALRRETHLSSFAFAASRFASQSRDCAWPSRSNSILPLIVSPLILPLYFVVTLFPLNSRVT